MVVKPLEGTTNPSDGQNWIIKINNFCVKVRNDIIKRIFNPLLLIGVLTFTTYKPSNTLQSEYNHSIGILSRKKNGLL